MAALLCPAAVTTVPLRHRKTHTPRETIVLVSCSSSSLPTKPTKRKNYLRQKFLKTQRNPHIPELPPSSPITPNDSPFLEEIKEPEVIRDFSEFDRSIISEAENELVDEVEVLREAQVSEPSGDVNAGRLGKNSVLKYGLWLIGAFVFQTVCAIWVFGSHDFENKNEISNGNKNSLVLDVGGNGKDKKRGKVVSTGNGNGNLGLDTVLYLDELEMEKKIEEIRVMAREVREKERLESKKNGFDLGENGEEIEGGKYSKSGVEEEVENRLIKLRKKLENSRDKMHVASIGYSRKGVEMENGIENGELIDGEGNGALLFKKKYKFKHVLDDPMEKRPKGFSGSSNIRIDKSPEIANMDGSDAVVLLEEDQKRSMPETELTKNTGKKERGTRKEGNHKGVAKAKVIDVNSRKSNAESVKSRRSGALDNAVVPSELSNNTVKSVGAGIAKSAIKSESATEFWWLNLPYVLAILMRRGEDGEGGEGFYTLKSTSNEEGHMSRVVAFEDRVDATNFCYLLESFFEELENFKADVVPLTVRELREAVKSKSMRVIVVKKGQLRLYAGQPLADAEIALHDLVKQG